MKLILFADMQFIFLSFCLALKCFSILILIPLTNHFLPVWFAMKLVSSRLYLFLFESRRCFMCLPLNYLLIKNISGFICPFPTYNAVVVFPPCHIHCLYGISNQVSCLPIPITTRFHFHGIPCF